MSAPDLPFIEYDIISKTRFLNFRNQYYKEKDWEELCRYSTLLKDWAKKGDVEEEPGPKGDNLYFGGFIGNYRLNSGREFRILLNQKKISDNEYQMTLDEVIDWSYLIGPNFYSRFVFSQPLHEFENILSYSNHLIDLTDLAFASYLSPVIEQVTKISPTVHGRINIQKTTRNLIQSQTLIVSKKTRLRSDTLPILLLIRFNYELSRRIQRYLKNLEKKVGNTSRIRTSFETVLMKNAAFHQSILLNPRIRGMVEKSLNIDFYNPDVLQDTIKQSNGNSIYQDLVLLWEGYSANRSLYILPETHLRGGYSLKPVSKLYELWILKQIINILNESFNRYSYIPNKTGITFSFFNESEQINLYYDSSINNYKKFDRLPSSMYPDFLISRKNEIKNIVIALDAKYKQSSESSDIEQLMAYMLITGWTSPSDTMNGAILYVGNRDANNSINNYNRLHPSANISKICVRPDFSEGYNDLKNLLTEALKLQ